MSLMSALTAGQKTKLRSKYGATQYISFLPQTEVHTGSVTAVPSTTSFASLTVSTSTGSTANIKAGMVCRISKSSDYKRAFFFGRARKAAAGTTVYINETSADIEVGDKIAFYDDYAVLPKLSRESGGVRLIDWDVTFRQLPPVIYDVDSIYVGRVDSSIGNTLEIEFSASAFAATDGASISSYAWTSPDGSVVAGSAATANVTYRFPVGFRHVQLVVTDSGARTTTRQIPVLAHGSGFLPEDGYNGASISGSAENGWSASIEAFEGVSGRLDLEQCVIWSVEHFSTGNMPSESDEGPIVGNVEFHGRLRTESDSARTDENYIIDTTTTYEIESVSQQLQRLHAPILTIINDTSPTAWDEIDTATLWRSLVYILAEYSTFLTSHSLDFDDKTDTYIERELTVSEQDLWSAANYIMDGVNARIELDCRGNAFVSRSANYLTTAERAALTVVLDDGSSDDWITIGIDVDGAQSTGLVNGSGGSYNTATDDVIPLLSIAPGSAQDTAPGIGNLPGQILEADVSEADAQAEINQRTGDHFAAVNPTDMLSLECPPAYWIFQPSRSEWFKFTVAASDTLGRNTYTTSDRWLLSEISHTFNNETNTRSVQLRFRLETSGNAGQTQPVIPAFGVSYYLPELPPFSPLPELGLDPWWQSNNDVGYLPPFYQKPPSKPDIYVGPPSNGNTVVCWDRKSTSTNESDLFLTINFLSATPTFRQITPDASTAREIKDFKFKSPQTSLEAYCLTWDGTNSVFWHTENFTANPVEWTENAVDTDEWSRIEVTDEGVYIIRASIPSGGAISETITADGTSATVDQLTLYTSPNVTYTVDCSGEITWAAGGRKYDAFYITTDNWASQTKRRWDSTEEPRIQSTDMPTDFEYPAYSGTHVYSVEIDGNCERWSVNFVDSSYVDNSGSVDFDVSGSPSGIATAYSRYSSDDGGTFAAEVTIGTAPGVGSACGFDTIRIGDSAIAGGNSVARVTTTEGGAYANETNTPTASNMGIMVDIPFWQIPGASTKNINDSSPHYYIASRILSSGNALWKVADAAAVAIQPEADATAYTANGIATMQITSSKLAVIMTVGITPSLYTTDDAGSTWTDRGEVGLNAVSVRTRRGDLLGLQLFGAGGTDDLWYSSNFGASIRGSNGPNNGQRAMRGAEVWG